MEALRDERFYWPVRLLRHLGRLPHDGETFLWTGHTVHGDRSRPYAPDTRLCASLIVPPMFAPPEFGEFDVHGGRSVRILGVLPLYAEELDVKLQHGLGALMDLIGGADLTVVVGPHRKNLAIRRPIRWCARR
jgi:hypothetical protein